MGIIERVVMVDFMCHKYLKFFFGPQINFIIGKCLPPPGRAPECLIWSSSQVTTAVSLKPQRHHTLPNAFSQAVRVLF